MKQKENLEESIEEKWDDIKLKLFFELKKVFKPEFLNRIDEIVVFRALTKKQLDKIIQIMLKNTRKLLHAQKMNLEVTVPAMKQLVELGYEPQFGARPLRRIIQRELENPISEQILQGKFKENDTIKVDFINSNFTFNK